MNTRSFALPWISLAALVSGAAGSVASAQPASPTPAPTPAHPSAPTAAQVPESYEPVITINFQGGTLAKLGLSIKEASGRPMNLLISPEVAGAEVPPVVLASVPVWRALKAIEFTIPGVSVEFMDEGGGAPVYILHGKARSASPRTVQTVSLARVIRPGGLSADTVLSAVTAAIDAGREVNPDQPAAEVLYHPESSLLIVQGTNAQIAMVTNVVMTLIPPEDRAGQASTAALMDALGVPTFEQAKALVESLRAEAARHREMVLKAEVESRQHKVEADYWKQMLESRVAELDRLRTRLEETTKVLGERAQSLQSQVQRLQDENERLRNAGAK
ncbi:MAG: hypothetical protein HRU70_00570 [Phycisphaeraceae bacterium]|nr:MAG: hypothetical protein HRU70_00570 [Phycisphaeraceae bacterium]